MTTADTAASTGRMPDQYRRCRQTPGNAQDVIAVLRRRRPAHPRRCYRGRAATLVGGIAAFSGRRPPIVPARGVVSQAMCEQQRWRLG